MLEHRYQVFVSSTFADLKDERQEVMQAILELGCFPAGMELFPASNESQWELIRRVIDDSDYYVVIVGGRYGSTDPDGVGFTEREYDYARTQGIPMLSFVHEDPESIIVRKSENTDEGRRRLANFKAKVLNDKMCKFWNSAGDLGGKVSRSLFQAIQFNPREGWVRRFSASNPGGVTVYRSFQSGGINWDEYFASASEIYLLFAGSETWRSHHFLRLRDFCSRQGSSIKVLLPDPSETMVKIRMGAWIKVGEDKVDVDMKIKEATAFFADLASNYSACSVEVLGIEEVPYFSFFRFDNRGLISFYSHLRTLTAVPTLASQKGEMIFDYAVHEFEGLENKARKEGRIFFQGGRL